MQHTVNRSTAIIKQTYAMYIYETKESPSGRSFVSLLSFDKYQRENTVIIIKAICFSKCLRPPNNKKFGLIFN